MKIPFTNTTIEAYNILSCKGFDTADKVGLSFGNCAKAKLVLVVLFFINAFIRKWIGEEIGIEYSFWGGLGGSVLAYLILVGITGNIMVAFVAGVIGMAVGGFLGGQIFGGGDDYE